MSALTALSIVQWVALVVLYLALAAVLGEVRMLRAQVSRLQAGLSAGLGGDDAPGFASNPAGRLGVRLETVAPGRPAIVLAATSSCPLCRLLLEHLDTRRADPEQSDLEQPERETVLLTHEDAQAWGAQPRRLRVVRDDAAWSQIAHLEPPLLLRLDPDGTVADLVLPVSESDVDSALRAWSAQPAH